MLKYRETEYTGRLQSEEKVQSRKSYHENQDIYPERLHPTIIEWVIEKDFKVLFGNAARQAGRKTWRCVLLTFISGIPGNRTWRFKWVNGNPGLVYR